jgi:hypothetical protein
VSMNASDSEAVQVCPVTSITGGKGANSWIRRLWNLFRTIRRFHSDWLDASPYHHVSSGRELSMVVTSNGPLVYRWDSNGQRTKRGDADQSEQL